MTEETVTLKEYFERIMAERDKAITAALISAEKAVDVAERNSKSWRDGANEWRAAMNDREVNFSKIEDIENVKKELAEVKSFMALHSGTVTEIASLTNEVKILNTFKDTTKGKADQSSVNVAMIFASISSLIAVISIILNLVNTLAK